MMTETTRNIIENNIEAIENNDFDKVYEPLINHTATHWVTELTEAFFDAGINPTSYIKNIIPSKFAIDLKNSPSNITVNAEIIQSNAFYNCSNITSVTFNPDVRIIGYASFSRLPNLINVEIKEGVTQIQSNAFYDCPKLRHILLPKSIKMLGFAIFAKCSHNLKIEYDGTVEEFNQNVECARLEAMPKRTIYCSDGTVEA